MKSMRTTHLLVILDGFGIGARDESNPIYRADPPTLNMIHRSFPGCALQASGNAVGLAWDEVGNSEVGHLTIGAGKILYQYFPRITRAIQDKSFFENPALKNAYAHAHKNSSTIHLVGLLTEGTVHASFDHLVALIEMAQKESCANLSLHLFSDGIDKNPRALTGLLQKLEMIIKEKGVGIISTITGRYYAMNRDGHYDRTEHTYRTLVENKGSHEPIETVIQKTYAKELSDEFIEPTIFHNAKMISENDAVIFFNFREDSMKQIAAPFVSPSFNTFQTTLPANLFVTTMTSYDSSYNAHVAFPPEQVEEPLGKVLADNQKTQLRIAETEKYAHITYFLNGLRKEPFENEFRVLIPTENIPRHDARPEMQARAITDRALAALADGAFDLIVINYANPDIVAHTGNYEATVKAIHAVDGEIKRLMDAVIENNHTLIITSDHGNAERVLNPVTGERETGHDPNPVPFYLINKKFQKTTQEPPFYNLPLIGILSDITPTILELMDLPKPPSMTGQSLLKELNNNY